MNIHLSVFFMIEIVGTIAFACSGALVAIKKNLDLLGVIVLGVTTAVGGGMLRDLLIGIHPPALFVNPVYVLAAFVAVLILFAFVRYRRITMEALSSLWYERVMNLLDAIGLGACDLIVTSVLHFAGTVQWIFDEKRLCFRNLVIILVGRKPACPEKENPQDGTAGPSWCLM